MIGRSQSLAMLGAGVVATSVLVSLPVLAAGMAAQVGGGERAIGVLAAADMAGSALASLIALPFIGRMNWRPAALGAIAIVVLGNAFSTLAGSVWVLAAARVLTGAGSGLVVALAFVGLCHSTNPDRYFGIYVFAQLGLQAALMWAFPLALATAGMWPIYATLAGLPAASAVLVRLFPENAADAGALTRGPDARSAAVPARAGTFGLVGLAAYFVAAGAIWSYLEPIGGDFGLDTAEVGTALAAAAFAGMAGSLLVVVLATRFGRLSCLGVGTAVGILALLLLLGGGHETRYRAGVGLFTLAWNFAFPYQMGLLSQLDRTGGIAISSLVIQLLALALGPLLAAAIVSGAGHATILWTGAALLFASFACFAAGARLAVQR